ncbi:MAG: hypothetical protein ACJAS1_002625 [Oleiphilaceae bacterium]|jgi:hypothetical protein
MNAVLSGVIGVLVGVFIGHRFALDRDKRKEHNDVVRPLKQKVLRQLDMLTNGEIGSFLNDKDLQILRTIISEKKYEKIIDTRRECFEMMSKYAFVNDKGYERYRKECYEKVFLKVRDLNCLLKLK